MSLLAFLVMSAFTLIFATLLIFAVVPLGMYRQAAFAVLKRNFVGYFLNPTGYVFLALFVVLTSFAAFWPNGFFSSNLANFEQLATYLPYIMLVIIPAITMSTWSEEKRQGTDELLLTLPTTDVDIVLGSRTVQTFILSGANMGLFLRWGNWAVAKLTEALFNTVYLSDVGCTFRVVTRAGLTEYRSGDVFLPIASPAGEYASYIAPSFAGVSAVPEPSAWALLLAGGVFAAVRRLVAVRRGRTSARTLATA